MTFEQIRTAAEEMNVNLQHAVWCRLRYLRQRIQQEVEELDFWAESECPTSPAFFNRHMDTVTKLAREARALSLAAKEPPKERRGDDHITDEQIERARQYPVTQLIDFHRGKSHAWCHNDRNPSLYLAPRVNRVVCPVCAKYFSSIDVLMERDGLTFPEAVRRLAA